MSRINFPSTETFAVGVVLNTYNLTKMADVWEQNSAGAEETDSQIDENTRSGNVAEGFDDNFVPQTGETSTGACEDSKTGASGEVDSGMAPHTLLQPSQKKNKTNASETGITENRLSERKAKRNPSHTDIRDFQIELVCPRVNCPEKIVICLDVSPEMDKVSFRSRAGAKFAPLKLIKRAIGLFLQTKYRIDRRHEFALVLLHSTSYWATPFTNDPDTLMKVLDDVNTSYPSDSFDLGLLFDSVKEHVEMPHVKEPHLLPPPYIVRVIFIYGRSYCVPSFGSRESLKLLQCSPYFFLDAYYIHEPPSEENQCEEIFDVICDLDEKGLSYVFEVSRNPTKLYDYMAQLLPHPLQRPLQKDCSYNIEPSPTVEGT